MRWWSTPERDADWWRPCALALESHLSHRGPDGRGTFLDSALHQSRSLDVLLVHTRLTIIDAATGAQPMLSSRLSPDAASVPHDGSRPSDLLAVVFNGCIYNHRELRARLAALGHRFQSDHSDTEVLLHGYREWGEDVRTRLDGMYAFAIWDRAQSKLVLARDLAGEKPLYTAEFTTPDSSRHLAFASTAPALLALRRSLGLGNASIDRSRLAPWLAFGFSPSPPIQSLSALPPGSVSASTPSMSWRTPSADVPPNRVSADSLIEPNVAHIEALVRRSVTGRLEADVPVGCFLSGGIDSPLIASFAREARPDLQTFTVRMPDPRYDESARAERIAAHLGTRHRTLECDADPARDLQHLIGQLGLPLGDSSLLPTYWVSKAARPFVKVALSGDGADELFDGYARYRVPGILRRWGRILHMLPRVGGGTNPRSARQKLSRLIEAAHAWGYDSILAIFPCSCYSRVFPLMKRPDPLGERGNPSGADIRTYLPDDLLRKVDTASMAVALEVRAPFLAREVMDDRLARIPENRGRKEDLRRLAAARLPPDIARAPKSGFAIPIGEWFRTDFGGLRTLLGDTLGANDAFDPSIPIDRAAARAMADDHLASRMDHGQRLYHLLVLSLWCRSLRAS